MQPNKEDTHCSSPVEPATATRARVWPSNCCAYGLIALLVLAVFETFGHRKTAVPESSSSTFYSKWAISHSSPTLDAGETKYRDEEHLEPGPITLAAYKKISPGVFAASNVATALGPPANESHNPFGIQTDIYHFRDGDVIVTYMNKWVKSVSASGALITRLRSVQ